MSNKIYLPAHKRADQPPPMRLTARDRRLILAVYEYRLLSSHHIQVLFFSGAPGRPHSRRSACQRRLQLLYHHQYLDRIQLPLVMGEGRTPFVYALDKKGANVVASKLGIDREGVGWKPKHNDLGVQFLDHTLAINAVRVLLALLKRQRKLTEVRWTDESTLKSPAYQHRSPRLYKNSRASLIYPDGYFTIQMQPEGKSAHFFLEVDRATMSNKLWQDKIRAYLDFRQSGLSQQAYQTRNFRVLGITTTPTRLRNLKRATEDVGGGPFFWFTTQEQIDIWQPTRLLQPIWHIAGQKGMDMLFPQVSS